MRPTRSKTSRMRTRPLRPTAEYVGRKFREASYSERVREEPEQTPLKRCTSARIAATSSSRGRSRCARTVPTTRRGQGASKVRLARLSITHTPTARYPQPTRARHGAQYERRGSCEPLPLARRAPTPIVQVLHSIAAPTATTFAQVIGFRSFGTASSRRLCVDVTTRSHSVHIAPIEFAPHASSSLIAVIRAAVRRSELWANYRHPIDARSCVVARWAPVRSGHYRCKSWPHDPGTVAPSS